MNEKPILVISNGYHLDFHQLARLLRLIEESPVELNYASVSEQLGLAKRRVEAHYKLAVAMNLASKGRMSLTQMGQLVRRCDPFIGDKGTLWLLHYLISSSPRNYVWNRMANSVVPEHSTFDFQVAKAYFRDSSILFKGKTVMQRVRKEISTFVNAYVEQQFAALRYLCAQGKGTFVIGHRETIPIHILFAAILWYRERFRPSAHSLEIQMLADAHNSPGRVFNLTEREVRDLLEDVQKMGYVYVETRADLDQIRFRDDYDFIDIVRRYYEEH